MKSARKSVGEAELKRYEEFARQMKQNMGKGPSITDTPKSEAKPEVEESDLYG